MVRGTYSGNALLSEASTNCRCVVDNAWRAVLVFTISGYPGSVLGAISAGAFFVGLGVIYLFKYREPEVRAKHVEYWTAKA